VNSTLKTALEVALNIVFSPLTLGGCTSQPQFGNAVFIPSGNKDAGDGHTQDVLTADATAIDLYVDGGVDIVAGPDADTTDTPAPDADKISDTPIDVPPQPKLCTTQVTLPQSCNIVGITAGEAASCATTKDGALKCWGNITYEQFSKTQIIFSSPTPKVMEGFKNIAQASMYLQHLCARDTFGNAWCMGQNFWGQLGNGTQQNNTATAVKVQGAANIMQVAAGGFHSCAIDTSGTVYCWGYNINGQTGLGDTTASVITTAQKANFQQPTPIVSIALGSFHSSAIHESGAIYGWGHNGVKQLGLPTAGNKIYSPTFIDKSGYRFAAGDDFSCLIDKNCDVSCSGGGEMGQLGGGNTTSKAAFTPIKSLKDLAVVSANRQHACAATQSGTLYCWGDGTTTPTQIKGLAPVTQVAAGANHTCILDNSCAVYCWGDNAAGQLGNGTTQSSATPVKVTGL
jgi:alpha-tubulin suppressor-like RCC1 family protein